MLNQNPNPARDQMERDLAETEKATAPELKPCPCGQVPEFLEVDGDWHLSRRKVSGTCCQLWHLDFKPADTTASQAELMRQATDAWNNTPRPWDVEPKPDHHG